jgi:hypothetical protein
MSLDAAKQLADELHDLIVELEEHDKSVRNGGSPRPTARRALFAAARGKLAPIRIALTHALTQR